MKIIFFLLSLFAVKASEDFYKKFKDGVVPDVLDEVHEGVACLKLQYKDFTVNVGNEYTPDQTKTAPNVDWTPTKDKFYTLLFIDPDAPSRKDPKFREWHHWLVVNIPENKLNEGKTLTEYIGPKPPKDTGLHRYIFLVYEQPEGKINFDEQFQSTTDYASRKKFSTRAFIKKYKFGKPIAGTYFEAKYDGTY